MQLAYRNHKIRNGMMDFPFFNETLLSLTFKASLIAIFALALSLGLKRKEASIRSQIWSFAGLMLLAFPLVSMILPTWEIPFLEPQVIDMNSQAERSDIFNYLMGFWFCGFAFLMIRLISNMYQLRELRKNSEPVKNIKWLEISKQVSKSLNIHRKVTLLQSDKVTMPMTWGFFRPYVLIPTSGQRWNIRRKKMILLHEFEHVYRCDWMIQVLSNLALAIHWFNPLSWVVSFMIRLEREKACDDAVLRLGVSPTDYASTLLLFAKHKKETNAMGCALQLITGSQLHSRIQSILKKGVGRKRLSKTVGLSLGMMVLLSLLPISSAHSPTELIKKLECFPEEEFAASEINIVITPVKLNISESSQSITPVHQKNDEKACDKKKCNKAKKGQKTDLSNENPVILKA